MAIVSDVDNNILFEILIDSLIIYHGFWLFMASNP